jgi:isopenicillin-N epimerase
MNHLKEQFLLNPAITFLNFGSFGACPKPVFEAYQKYQLALEYEPVQIMVFKGPQYLETSRNALANFVGCQAKDLVYVTNPSYAVNIIAKSFPLNQGDEILSTNLEYGACDKTWQYYADKAKAKIVRVAITLPLSTKEKFVEEFFAGASNKTKLIFISHITSTTALIFPVQEIVAEAKKRNIPCFIDGAHAPAHIALNIQELDCDYYTGACHKWMLTPKGSSFLYVKPNLQKQIDPLVISWGYETTMPLESVLIDNHQLQGTRDFSAFLCIPDAIAFMQQNNWTQVSKDCKQLVLSNANNFATLLKTKPLAPLSSDFIGQMLSLEIKTENTMALQKHLYQQYYIEIPIMQLGNKQFIRFSINAFNTQQDLDILYKALQQIIEEGNWLQFA